MEPSLAPGGQIFTLLGAKLGSTFSNLKKKITLLEPSLAPGGQIHTLLGAKLGCTFSNLKEKNPPSWSQAWRQERRFSPFWKPNLAPAFQIWKKKIHPPGAKFGARRADSHPPGSQTWLHLFKFEEKKSTLLEPSLAPGGQILTLLGAKLGTPFFAI